MVAGRGPKKLRRRSPKKAPMGSTRDGNGARIARPDAPSRTERVHAQAMALLERHGVLTREAVSGEAVEGGFSGVTPSCACSRRAAGSRRGYFVDGLGAAQFALPGAGRPAAGPARPPGRARGGARPSHVDLLAAADPAKFRTAPRCPGRAAARPIAGRSSARPGAYVVLVDGAAVLYLERGGSTLQVLPAGDDPETRAIALGALGDLVADGRVRELVIGKIDGEPVGMLRVPRPPARARASSSGYRGYALRPTSSAAQDRQYARGRRRSAQRAGRCRKATRCSGRPPGCGRTSSAGSSTRRVLASPGRRRTALVGATVTGVEAQGKNLLIRFYNGLEVRTHRGMHGSWHRYRPGERWRRPPARARGS